MKFLVYSVSVFLAAIFFEVCIYFIDILIKGGDVKLEVLRSGVGS